MVTDEAHIGVQSFDDTTHLSAELVRYLAAVARHPSNSKVPFISSSPFLELVLKLVITSYATLVTQAYKTASYIALDQTT